MEPEEAEDVAAAGQLALVAGTGTAAELVAELPVWDAAEGIRNTQAADYWKRVTAALKDESGAERVSRNRAQLARAFPSLSPAGWTVKYNNRAYSCSHPDIMGGTTFTGLTALVRATATYLHQQDVARVEAEEKEQVGQVAEDLLSLGPASADVSGALAEVSQLIASDGPLHILAKSMRAVDEEEAVTPLEVSLESLISDMTTEVYSTVIVGATNIGKSVVENNILMATEVDPLTYASADHKKGMPSFVLRAGAEPMQLESLGLIRVLLSREGLRGPELEAAFIARLGEIYYPASVSCTPTATKMACDEMLHVHMQVENYLFPLTRERMNLLPVSVSEQRVPQFIMPVGCGSGVTTRLATAARYSAKYEVFAHLLTQEEMVAKLLDILQQERMHLSLRLPGELQSGKDLPIDATRARQENIEFWNAVVKTDEGLGGGADVALAYLKHSRGEVPPPALFLNAEEPTEEQLLLLLHADVSVMLGKFIIFAGKGVDQNVDRKFVREQMTKMMQQKGNRMAFVAKKVYYHGPHLILKGGKELVDAPGTLDETPLHRRHLLEACNNAHHIVLFAGKNLSVANGGVDFLVEFKILDRFLKASPDLKLTIVHNLEAQVNIRLESFRDEVYQNRLADEETAKELSMDFLVQKLMTVIGEGRGPEITIEQAKEMVEERVQCIPLYLMSYVSLLFNPKQTARLPDADQIVQRTHGAELLGLLDGTNLDSSAERLFKFMDTPLAVAREELNCSMAALREDMNGPERGELLSKAKKQLSVKRTSEGSQMIRRALSHEFYKGRALEPEAGPDGAPSRCMRTSAEEDPSPRDILHEMVESVYISFEAELDTVIHVPLGAAAAAAAADVYSPSVMRSRAAWDAASSLFVVHGNQRPHIVTERCRRAVGAALSKEPGAAPPKMDLYNILLSSIVLPDDTVAQLTTNTDSALADCVSACSKLVQSHLLDVVGRGVMALKLINTEYDRIARYTLASRLHTKPDKGNLLPLSAGISTAVMRDLMLRAKVKALSSALKTFVPPVAIDSYSSALLEFIDTKFGFIMTRVKKEILSSMRELLNNMVVEVETALVPVETVAQDDRARVGGKTMPGMESCFLKGLKHVERRLNNAAVVAAVTSLQSSQADCAEMILRIQRLVKELRSLRDNPHMLAHAVERGVVFHVLLREGSQFGTIATPSQLNVKALFSVPEGALVVNLENLPIIAADSANIQALDAALSTLEPALMMKRTCKFDEDAHASLWGSLAKLMFCSRNAAENQPAALRAFTRSFMLQRYASDTAAAAFQAAHAMTVADYLRARQDAEGGESANTGGGAGLLELVAVCSMYGVQICLWPSTMDGEEPVPLLIKAQAGAAATTAYHIVLENTLTVALADGSSVPVHLFQATQRRKMIGGITFSESIEDVRIIPGKDNPESKALFEHLHSPAASKLLEANKGEDGQERRLKKRRHDAIRGKLGAPSTDEERAAMEAEDNAAQNKALTDRPDMIAKKHRRDGGGGAGSAAGPA